MSILQWWFDWPRTKTKSPSDDAPSWKVVGVIDVVGATNVRRGDRRCDLGLPKIYTTAYRPSKRKGFS